MMQLDVIRPSKPRVVTEENNKGIYEIDGLYPGYGHTLGNSLRRIVLSSMPGVAVTMVKIDGVPHEFSTMEGVKEDVITMLLNLQRVRFRMATDEPQKLVLKVSGVKDVTAGDITVPGQVELLDPELKICTLTDKKSSLDMEITIEKGLGYTPKELVHKDRLEVGAIALDAAFTPVKRVNYEVENMRVGDRTDYNRIRMFIETDGVISPREALERAIDIMISQLTAVRGFEEAALEATPVAPVEAEEGSDEAAPAAAAIAPEDISKAKIEDLGLTSRTVNALSLGGIRTVGGLMRKKEEDLLELSGLGEKGIKEIRRALSNYGITLK